MDRRKNLILTLTLWISLTVCPQVECGQDGKEEAGVTIELTKLDVNDTTLELSWKIKNNTDYDVWICDSLSPEYPSFYEYFLDKDAKTLVLRRRFDLPMREDLRMSYPPLRSRYVRLRSSQEKAESVSLAIPVRPYRISIGESANAEYARRLALEIGFYDEDLPGLILQIVELAEKLNCDLDVGLQDFREIRERFFGGRMIAQAFKHLLGFSESVTSGGDEIKIPYMGQVLNGEQVLRLEVDGAHIPYGSAPASEETANDEVEDTPITIALTNLDVNDTNLDLNYKIKNRSDHDIWILEKIIFPEYEYEVFMAEDDQTLVIRRRLDVPTVVTWFAPPEGSYIRLRQGDERTETLSLTLPIRPSRLFSFPISTAEFARRLVLEIGFYDENLPVMIRGILEGAERLSWADLVFDNSNQDIIEQYFTGLRIAYHFGGLSGFNNFHYQDENQVWIPYTFQELLGEQVLKITMDGMHIPYEEVMAAPINAQGKEEYKP